MEARLLEKLGALDGLEDRLRDLGEKLDQQATRLDQVQIKVDLSIRFDGQICLHLPHASIWVDSCETFFTLYQIAPGFQVSAATMYLSDAAAHWYHAFKRAHERLTWEQFRQAVLLEFDMDTHRVKMKELLQLRQTGTVAEYRRQFDRLFYQVKLYDPEIGGIMLVTQFVLGLKDDMRAVVEV